MPEDEERLHGDNCYEIEERTVLKTCPKYKYYVCYLDGERCPWGEIFEKYLDSLRAEMKRRLT